MFQSPLKKVAEKLKPVDSKLSVSSLRFERSSDFKKFIRFIKDETKELEKIKLPSATEIKPKSKGSGALGLLGLGAFGLLASLFGDEGDGKDDKFRIGGASAGSIKPIVPAGFSSLKPRTRDIAKIRTEKTFSKRMDKFRRKKLVESERLRTLQKRKERLRTIKKKLNLQTQTNTAKTTAAKRLFKSKITPKFSEIIGEEDLLIELKRRLIDGDIMDPPTVQLSIDDFIAEMDAKGLFDETDKLVNQADKIFRGEIPPETYTKQDFDAAKERITKSNNDIENTIEDD